MDNDRLIAEHYPQFLPYFRSATPAILRVDLVRLAYLHRFGGVYADLDYEVLRPLDGLLNTGHVIRMAIAIVDDCAEQRSQTHGDVTILPHELVYPSAPTLRVAERRRRDGDACGAFGVHHYANSWRTPLDRLINLGRAVIQRGAQTPRRSSGRPQRPPQSSGGTAP